jgi:hypothetical protein
MGADRNICDTVLTENVTYEEPFAAQLDKNFEGQACDIKQKRL